MQLQIGRYRSGWSAKVLKQMADENEDGAESPLCDGLFKPLRNLFYLRYREWKEIKFGLLISEPCPNDSNRNYGA